MPIDYPLDRSRDLIIETWSGTITASDAIFHDQDEAIVWLLQQSH